MSHFSQRTRLILLLLVIIGAIWAGFSVSSYFALKRQTLLLLDQQVRQVASILAETAPLVATGRVENDVTVQKFITEDYLPLAYHIFVDGKLTRSTAYGPKLDLQVPVGLSDYRIEDKAWRVQRTSISRNGSPVDVIVAVDHKLARLVISPMVDTLVWHFVLEIVSIFAVIVLIVRIVDQRLRRIIRRIARKGVVDLEDLPVERLPRDMRPLVAAVNLILARLRQALSTEREFLAHAAHELRTPLAAVRLQAQVAVEEPDEAQRKRLFDKMLAGIDRAAHVVSQLLLMARLDSAPKPEIQALVLRRVIERVKEDEAAFAAQNGARICNLIPVGTKVAGDPTLLPILVRNLVDNAIRYSPEGTDVEVRARVSGNNVVLRVTDRGAGVPPEHQARVFDRFVRLASHVQTGSGLGLALVKRVADIHHAKVYFRQGQRKQGFTVCVTLPRG